MSKIKFTKTATFLFPLLEIPKSLFDCDVKDRFGRFICNTRFLNAYLHDSNISKYQSTEDIDYVFIVIRNYQDVGFAAFQSTLRAFRNYVDDYDYKECFVAVFSVPYDNQKDFDLVKSGRYSEVSTIGKKLILANNFYSGKPFTLPLILNKAEVLKISWEERLSNPWSPAYLFDQEVWPIIDYSKEVLKKDTLESFEKKKDFIPSEEF